MHKSTTIIGVFEMLEDGYGYRDIRARHAVGNSTITDIKRKLENMDVSLSEFDGSLDDSSRQRNTVVIEQLNTYGWIDEGKNF